MRCTTFVLISLFALSAATSNAQQKVKRAKTGISRRTLWTTSRIVGTPDPPHPYQTVPAYPQLKLFEPLAVAQVPGTNRLAVAERPGKVFTFEDRANVSQKKLLIDVKRSIYAVALHPRFQSNGFLFVTRIQRGRDQHPGWVEVVRYTVKRPADLQADPASAKRIIRWEAGGHSGGCLRFGPDGYLYISVGDGSGIADQLKAGQNLRDLHGSILRIDVNRSEGELPYAIPSDNPLAYGTRFNPRPKPGQEAKCRPEIYSYGHRQVWKFSFDETGRLWAGEVGQDLWEMIYLIRKGGNYGWSVREGSHPFRPDRPKGPTDFVAPIVEHSHNDFRSITGGFIYNVKQSHPLNGFYIYGDYDTGKIWSLLYKGNKVVAQMELADTQHRLVAFAQRTNGEVLIVDFAQGGLFRLVPTPPSRSRGKNFPRKLSETGLFTSTKTRQLAPGLIPYSVNSPLWSDNAEKERFLAIPGKSQIQFDAVTYPQPAPGSHPGWRFPDGSVLVKTFSLEMETGNPKSRRLLETRILHHERMPGNDDEYGAQMWRGYTYVWNDEQTDAVLLDAKGLDRKFTIKDPRAPDGRREQTWHFPSRAECTLCHTMASKYVLGAHTLQMNKDHNYNGIVANQLSTLNHIGIFSKPLTKPAKELPRIVDYRDASASIADRARAYLHANCSHCHRKWGGGNAEFQLLATLPVNETGTVNVPPGQGKFQVTDPRILVPGNPDRSLLLHRMKLAGLGRMPHVASNIVHHEAIAIIEKWIRSLDKSQLSNDGVITGRPE